MNMSIKVFLDSPHLLYIIITDIICIIIIIIINKMYSRRHRELGYKNYYLIDIIMFMYIV